MNHLLNAMGSSPHVSKNVVEERNKKKQPEQKKLSEELHIEMQFAQVAEALRRACFAYGNRFIEAPHVDSDDDEEAIAKGGSEVDHKALIYQLPNTADAGPYDSARVSPSVLMAFAEDMMITPQLLVHDETTQAVLETLDRRRKRAHLCASMDKTLYDFIVVCAIKVMAKRPYCNVYGSATTRQKVRALVEFISVDYEQVVEHVLDSRFSVRVCVYVWGGVCVAVYVCVYIDMVVLKNL